MKEFKKYYKLRYEILRKPYGQTLGSEKDEIDETAIHRMIIDKRKKLVMAVGRLQFNSKREAQIRYMAVANKYQRKGLGSIIVKKLEEIALKQGANCIILQARENAVKFYQNNGYQIVKKTYVLFEVIQQKGSQNSQ